MLAAIIIFIIIIHKRGLIMGLMTFKDHFYQSSTKWHNNGCSLFA